MKRSVLKNANRLWKLRRLAGFALLAVMLPMTNSHAQPGTPGNAAGTEVPAWVMTEIANLQSTNAAERSAAILRLRHRGAAAAIPALIQMLGSGAEFPRMALMVSSLAPLTRSCSLECTVGGEAAETLARIGQTPGDLLALLQSGDWRTRANTVRAVGGLKERSAVEELMAIVERHEEHWEVKGNAALALGLIGDKRAVQPLLTALKDSNARVRGGAATALGEIKVPVSLQPLIAALKDGDPEVRRNAAGSLGRMEDAAAVEPLVQMLRDEDRTVREVTASALGWIKDGRAVSALMAALKDPYVNVQINAAGALGQIKTPAAVDPLIGLLANEESAARAAAAAALGELGDPRAREPLVAMVRREDRWEIPLLRGLQALAKLGHPGAETALREYERHRPDWKEWWSSNRELLFK